MVLRRVEDIEAWQIARELTIRIYQTTKEGSFARDFGLRDQICRAVVSIMSNIAEGFDSGSSAEFIRFLSYAQRSCTEVKSQLYVALDQNYIDRDQFEYLYNTASKCSSKIGAFIKYLKTNTRNQKQTTKNQERRTKNC